MATVLGGPEAVTVGSNQPLGNHVTDDFVVRMHVHFLEDPGPLGGDGFVAEVETFGDFPHGPAFGDHEHHLAFAIRESVMKGFWGVEIHFEGQFFRDAVADVFSSAGDLVDGGDQLVGTAGPG